MKFSKTSISCFKGFYRNKKSYLWDFLPSKNDYITLGLKKLVCICVSLILIVGVLSASITIFDNRMHSSWAKKVSALWEQDNDLKQNNAKFKTINEDYCAFLKIDGTEICCPVMLSDSDYYVNHSIYKKYNSDGELYIADTGLQPTYRQNLVIYGNNNSSLSKFGTLSNLRYKSWYGQENYIWLYTDTSALNYRVIYVYVADDTIDCEKQFYNASEIVYYGNDAYNRSIFYADYTISTADTLLTLVTQDDFCKDARLVVVAALVDDSVNYNKDIIINTLDGSN